MRAGRRVCPGLNVGALNARTTAACILYCFDITEDPVSARRRSAFILSWLGKNHPIDTFNTLWEEDPTKAPFKVSVTPRSKAHIELIEMEGAIALAAITDTIVVIEFWFASLEAQLKPLINPLNSQESLLEPCRVQK